MPPPSVRLISPKLSLINWSAATTVGSVLIGHRLMAQGTYAPLSGFGMNIRENDLTNVYRPRPSNPFTMLSHSSSSAARQTGLPARLYQ